MRSYERGNDVKRFPVGVLSELYANRRHSRSRDCSAYLGGGWMDVVLGKARSPTCLLLRSTHYPPFFPRFAHCTSTSICYPGVEPSLCSVDANSGVNAAGAEGPLHAFDVQSGPPCAPQHVTCPMSTHLTPDVRPGARNKSETWVGGYGEARSRQVCHQTRKVGMRKQGRPYYITFLLLHQAQLAGLEHLR
jgi:hypothetical protein